MSVVGSAVQKKVTMGQGGPGSPDSYIIGYSGITGDVSGGHIIASWQIPSSYAFALAYVSILRTNVSGSTPAPGYAHLTTGVDAQSGHNEQMVIEIPTVAVTFTDPSATYRSGNMVKGPPVVFIPDGEAQPTLSIYLPNNVNGSTNILCYRAILWDPEVVRKADMGDLLKYLP